MELRIKELRKRAGITQAELAEKLGIKSASAVTMWERGDRNPKSAMLPQIAQALGCTVGELYGEQTGEARREG